MSDTLLMKALKEAEKSARSRSFEGPRIPPSPEELKRIRIELGLSQELFARRLGVSIGTVQSWEIGRRRPGRLTRGLIARTLEEVS
jgi:putative transcriptional regulator